MSWTCGVPSLDAVTVVDTEKDITNSTRASYMEHVKYVLTMVLPMPYAMPDILWKPGQSQQPLIIPVHQRKPQVA
jgi:hypothetical protein